MTQPAIELQESPSAEVLDAIVGGVRAFNRAAAGHPPPRPVACVVRNAEGGIDGGVWAELWGRSVHIAALWVDERLRGGGLGARLLREVEAYAARQGHRLAYVETLGFQARPFYERQGYRVFGVLDEIAEGTSFYFMRKDLPAASSEP
ncbi:MAG TPA: GNAT family N-acetyltransferase [Longimicrobium sp.]